MTTGSELTTDEMLDRFVEFSAEVTAFSAFDLWGTGQAEPYFNTVLDQVGEATLSGLLEAYPPPRTEESEGRSDRLKQDIFRHEVHGPVARSIIKLWYVGAWYEPEWNEAGGSFVVSSASYAEGLLWRAIGAHPPGAKGPGYGSWAAPPTIEDYA